MRAVPGQRERVLAVVRALKTAGVRVRNWKNFIQTQPARQESLQTFAFGRDLQLLPQHHLPELEGTVPLFLVEACEYLSRHLHTEGLFRKTGSLARIRAVRADLERGERVFCPPLDAALQPCDVASLLKQFLRELPQPLVPADLQGALCQAQTLEAEGPRDRATLLLTALLPPAHARTLRYFCTFLSRVAHRCDENRMEVGNLALVMAPNLLQCPTQPCRLTVHTEKQLDQQTAVIKALISHAQHIGVLPSSVLDSLASVEVPESAPPGEGAVFSNRLSVYRSLRRQRRRSVGEMFVDAFSKLRAGRTSTMTLDSPLEGRPLSRSPNPESPGAGKRKASEETAMEMDGSAKKRRSLHDLRDDVQSISSHSADESTDCPSPQGLKNSGEDLYHNVTKRKIRAHRKSYWPPRQEEQIHGRRRSLRFFTMSGGGGGGNLVHDGTACFDPDPCKLHEDKPSNSDSETALKIPFILIDGSRTVLVGSEVDDDPDLLNCSFVETSDEAVKLETPETFHTLQRQDSEEPSEEDDDDHWVLLEDGSPEVVVEYKVKQDLHQTETQPQAEDESPNEEGTTQMEEKEEWPPLEPKQFNKISKKRSRPRRSISMPEVTLEPCSDEADESPKEIGVKQSAFDFWSESVNLPPSEGNKAGGKEKERRENAVRRKCGSVLERKKDEMTHSDPSSKRTQRRSVAERLKSFSALAAFLRTPRTTVRLRRQGARRFSRSFSHEGVPELVPGESPQTPQEDQQAFVDLSEGCGDSSQDSCPQLLLDALVAAGGPAVNPPSKPSSVEDVTLVGSPQRSVETQQLQLEEPELQSVLGSDGHEPELDLHDLLEQQCHVADQDQDQDQDSAVFSQSTPQEHRLTVLYTAPSLPHQQGESLNSLIDFHSSPAADCSQCSSFSERYPGPGSSPPYEASQCKDITRLSFDGLISISSNVSEKYSLSLDLSPPAFQFRQQGSRRRYRDSPRWPSHRVRMTTWKPLPL